VILKVALDTPLRRVFDYRAPAAARLAEGDSVAPQPGVRVRVPFGRRQLIGILMATAAGTAVPAAKLKSAIEILDTDPVFDPVTFGLLRWASDYYHHPVGEVFAAALPAGLREGQSTAIETGRFALTAAGRAQLAVAVAGAGRRAPRQYALLRALESGPHSRDALRPHTDAARLRAAIARGWIEISYQPPAAPPLQAYPSEVELTRAQTGVIATILSSLQSFAVHLLHGVTGSGKTEVYLRSIAAAIAGGGQALVLVPEIALTPQLVERFRRRFTGAIAVLHSGLTGTERRDAWRSAHGGQARIVIGTRSAVFVSLPRLALIVVDEEHDASYKQHEGFRYSARDLAVLRAQRARVPILLGSATPSLETLENAIAGRYTRLLLPERPGAAEPPRLQLVDLTRHASDQGLSQPALQAIERHLGGGGQIIVFLNRRGYAPTLFCSACGWVAPCAHCDARMTLHRRAQRLRCHHCGAQATVPLVCGQCGQPVGPVGQGTERVEDHLARLFPEHELARLDRDTATGSRAMEAVLERVHSGSARILIGTQMLTKGHHFPDVSLVVILDADQGLFATDYRATERLAQTIIQVAGRAGRANRAGEVMIQTAFPAHPLLKRLIEEGYEGFAAGALAERRDANWPPFSRLALLRAEARDEADLETFLQAAFARASAQGVTVQGPAPALMARRADHFRAHLLIEAAARPALQRFLQGWLPQVDQLPAPRGLRWSIDVDPLELD
jgi:primosomal protein N' (replication factor Y)